jgi:S1-C subfamily serine protease
MGSKSVNWRRRGALFLVVQLLFAGLAIGAVRASGANAGDVFDAVLKLTAEVPEDARTAKSLGTQREGYAVAIDSNGLALTIGYLILEAEAVTLTTGDGRVVPAQILAYDHDTGFGMVRALQPLGIKPLRMGDSGTAADGSDVLVVGHGGAANAIAARVVSRRDFAGYWEYLLKDAIFTVPPFARFGGAALVNDAGQLVGIGSLIIPNAAGPDIHSPGNMFVPINALKPIMADLLDSGRSGRRQNPWIGLYTAEQSGFLIVQRLASDGPSARAGIAAGDIVVSVAGNPVSGQIDFYRKLWALGGPGTTVELTVLKPGGGLRTVSVQSTDRYSWLRLSKGN